MSLVTFETQTKEGMAVEVTADVLRYRLNDVKAQQVQINSVRFMDERGEVPGYLYSSADRCCWEAEALDYT